MAGELVEEFELVLGRGESELGGLGRSVGELGETSAKDLSEGLSRESEGFLKEIEKDSEKLGTMTAKDAELLETPNERFETAERNGQFRDAEKKVEVNEEEKSIIKANEKEVTSLKTRFKAKIKGLFTRFRSFMKSPLGKAIVESIGSVMKYMFIADMVKETLVGIDKIVTHATKGGQLGAKPLTDEEKATTKKLDTFLKLVNALYNIVNGMKATLQNAASFDTNGDPDDHMSGQYLAQDMSTRNDRVLHNAVDEAAVASSNLLVNLRDAVNATGFSKDVEDEKFVQSVVSNPTLLTAGIKKVDLDAMHAFGTKVSTLDSVSKRIIEETFPVSSNQKEHEVVSLFFRLPTTWDASEKELEDFIHKVRAPNARR